MNIVKIIFFIISILMNKFLIINSKNLDEQQYHLKNSNLNCDSVKKYFDTINLDLDNNNKGPICSGHCCSNSTEIQLKDKATSNFERFLRDHTKSLRGTLEKTSNSFRDHILELSRQSENKTLHVFSQVYRRLFPFSKNLIENLYTSIRNHITTLNDNELEIEVHNFFVNLFPIAYHQAVHLNNGDASETTTTSNNGDLHDDYINCLKHTYDDLSPFGSIPKELSKNLLKSVISANIFIRSLEQGAEVLASTYELDSMYLTSTCKTQLLKMSFCQSCNGHVKQNVKPCYSYCLNVMRGCVTQYVGILDGPWSNVAEAIERLVTTSVQSDNGIANTIKSLDIKLSEGIMRAMENREELEKKVKKTCGTPKLLPIIDDPDIRTTQMVQHNKWATPEDAEMLSFLSSIEKSKDFYSKIVNNLCEDIEYQRDDRHCWTGDRTGDYTQTVMAIGVDAQRYNPEVPFVQHSYAQVTKLNELVDKLIKLRSVIVNSLPSNTKVYSDIQSDMARQDDFEGSGGKFRSDDIDDEEFGHPGSGDGSGDGPLTSTPDYSSRSNFGSADTNTLHTSESSEKSTPGRGSGATRLQFNSISYLLILFIIFNFKFQLINFYNF